MRTCSTTCRRSHRRGAIAITLVIALIVLSLLITTTLILGAQDQSLMLLRLQGQRTQFAADSAAAMASKEIFDNVDRDGDGGIGTISNDGNTGTDPTLNGTRLWATASTSGGSTTITARGQNNEGKRAAQVVASSTTAASSPIAFFSRSWETNHYTSTYSSGAWGAASQYSTGPDESIWMRAVGCPTRNEVAVATLDYSMDVRLIFNSAGVYSSATVATLNTNGYGHRRFDVAYEQSSGDLLLAYWDQATTSIGYRTASGTTVSAQSTLTPPATAQNRFVALIPKPGSNEIMLLAMNASSRLWACVWNGSSWGSTTTLSTTVSSIATECFAGAYERSSGDFLVVYGTGTSSQAAYRTYSGGSWSAESSMPATTNYPRWMRLASKPGSDEIACANLDFSDAVFANVWSGSSWGTVQSLGTTGGVCEERRIDVAYQPNGTHALVAYSTGANTVMYRTWNGTSWSAQQTGPDFGGAISIVLLVPGASGSDIYGLCTDVGWQLNGFAWNGTGLTGSAMINDPLGGEAYCEAFSLVIPNSTTKKITGWTYVLP